MENHPAEYARQGLKLLREVLKKFIKNKGDSNKIHELIAHYNPKIKKLYNSHQDWDDKEYFFKHIELFIVGGIISMFLVVGSVLILENIQLLKINSLEGILKIYLLISVIGGFLWSYFRGPKRLTESEMKDKLLMKLYDSPEFLNEKYEKIKKKYKPIRSIIKEIQKIQPDVIPINSENQKILQDAIPTDNENQMISIQNDESDDKIVDIKKKRKKWGLTQKERDQRKNILSLRFVMKISKLKEDVVEEKEYTKLLIVIIDSDQLVLQRLEAVLDQKYNVDLISDFDKITDYSSEQEPGFIIIETDFPDIDNLQIMQAISEKFDLEKIPAVIYTDKEDLESLISAKELSLVDYWIKEYSNDDELIIDDKLFKGKINQILSNARSGFARQLDRRIRRKQFQEQNVDVQEIDEHSQKQASKVAIISKDQLFSTYLKDELMKYNTNSLLIDMSQNIFSIVISEKPELVILDENIADEGISNICRMLNVRLNNAQLILIINDLNKFNHEIESKELKILKKFTRPYIQTEILEYIIENLDVEEEVVVGEAKDEIG